MDLLLWIILLVTCLIFWLYIRTPRLKIPGPAGLPILGNIFQISATHPHLTMEKWAAKYGDIFVVKTFMNNNIILNTSDLTYSFMLKDLHAFGDRGCSYRVNFLTMGMKSITSGSSMSRHWSLLRKATHKYIKLQSSVTLDIEAMITDVIGDFMEKFSANNGEAFDIFRDLNVFTLDALYPLLFGEKRTSEKELELCLDISDKFLSKVSPSGKGILLDQFPWLRFFGSKIFRELQELHAALDTLYEKKKFDLKQHFPLPDCLFAHLLTYSETSNNKDNRTDLDETNIKVAIMDLIAAGIETTSVTIYNLLKLLLHHPDVQKMLHDEADSVDGPVTLYDLERMPYTRATILEVLRHTSTAPIVFPRSNREDTTMCGYFVPKGTWVSVNVWVISHDNKFWDSPWEFRPERFLDESGNLLPPDHPNRKRLVPFGVGARVCVGEVFALNRIFLFIGRLMQKFQVLPEDENNLPPCDPREYESTVGIHPTKYKLRLVSR